MVPYIAYRRLLAEYASQHQASSSTAKQQENQKWWRGELEKFTKEYPAADDTPEATLQLAIAHEFIGQLAEARHWYTDLADRYPQTKAGHRAIGALRRLDLKGKAFDFSGPALGDGKAINAHDYHGKVLLVSYWSTWCTACTQDLPVLRSLYDQYNSKGFEILGVSLDVTADPIEPFLRQNKVSWPQDLSAGGNGERAGGCFRRDRPAADDPGRPAGKGGRGHHDRRRNQSRPARASRRQKGGLTQSHPLEAVPRRQMSANNTSVAHLSARITSKLEQAGRTLSAADAHGDHAVAHLAALHFVGQNADEASPRHAEGVTDRD